MTRGSFSPIFRSRPVPVWVGSLVLGMAVVSSPASAAPTEVEHANKKRVHATGVVDKCGRQSSSTAATKDPKHAKRREWQSKDRRWQQTKRPEGKAPKWHGWSGPKWSPKGTPPAKSGWKPVRRKRDRKKPLR